MLDALRQWEAASWSAFQVARTTGAAIPAATAATGNPAALAALRVISAAVAVRTARPRIAASTRATLLSALRRLSVGSTATAVVPLRVMKVIPVPLPANALHLLAAAASGGLVNGVFSSLTQPPLPKPPPPPSMPPPPALPPPALLLALLLTAFALGAALAIGAASRAGLLAPSRVVERRSVSSLTEEPEAESTAPPKVAATPSWLRTAALELGRADVTARQVLPPRSSSASSGSDAAEASPAESPSGAPTGAGTGVARRAVGSPGIRLRARARAQGRLESPRTPLQPLQLSMPPPHSPRAQTLAPKGCAGHGQDDLEEVELAV